MRHGLVAAAIGGLLVFQNCAQAPEQSLTGTSNSSYTNNLPLAVKGQIDTISYMSCSDSKDLDKNAYFTFRAGAYSDRTGGLQITPEFIEKTKYYTTTDRAKAFADSSSNGDTRFNLSIRSALNYQAPWVSDGVQVGQEIEAFLPPLDSPEIAGPLAATATQPRWINYFPGSSFQRLVEASIRYYEFENVMKDTRNSLEGGGSNPGGSYLVAGFSSSADESNTGLRTPGTSAASGSAAPVYGTGYRLLFSAGPGVNSGEKRVISSINNAVTEMDLSVSPPKATGAVWDCPNEWKFVIVRPEDKTAGKVDCKATVDRFEDTSQQQALAAIRRVLRYEDWFVDVNPARRCVIPKRTPDMCYGKLASRTIMYGAANCVNSADKICPHYVSVCIRR
jgi:hypothetical protein